MSVSFTRNLNFRVVFRFSCALQTSILCYYYSVSDTADGALKQEEFEAENMGAGWGRDGRSVMITLVIIIIYDSHAAVTCLGLLITAYCVIVALTDVLNWV